MHAHKSPRSTSAYALVAYVDLCICIRCACTSRLGRPVHVHQLQTRVMHTTRLIVTLTYPLGAPGHKIGVSRKGGGGRRPSGSVRSFSERTMIMSTHAVISHAQNLGTPLVMDIAPHVWESGTSPVRVNLVKTDPEYRACLLCGGEPLYRVVWDTPGAWWGDTHWERYCHACVTRRGIGEGWVRAEQRTGVSLAKAPIADWEREITHRADVGLSLGWGPDVSTPLDRALTMGPIGLRPALAHNNLRALSVTFGVMADLAN